MLHSKQEVELYLLTESTALRKILSAGHLVQQLYSCLFHRGHSWVLGQQTLTFCVSCREFSSQGEMEVQVSCGVVETIKWIREGLCNPVQEFHRREEDGVAGGGEREEREGGTGGEGRAEQGRMAAFCIYFSFSAKIEFCGLVYSMGFTLRLTLGLLHPVIVVC